MTLAAAALLALGLVGVVVLSTDRAERIRGEQPPEGPALTLAGRAGLVTVVVAARATNLQLDLIAPNVGGVDPELGEVRLVSPTGTERALRLRSCGDDCHVADTGLAAGMSTLRVTTSFAGRPGVVALRLPSPAPDGRDTLRRAVAATGRLATVTVRERLTSDTNGRFFTNPPVRVSGRELVAIYGAEFAEDIRELRSDGGLRRVAFRLRAASLWFELWIDARGVIVRDRITGPNHLILRTLTSPRSALRRLSRGSR